MIDEANHRIYVDYSTLAKFQACKELARLGSFQGYRLQAHDPKLAFGHAIHAGWAAYYDALAGGFHDAEGKWHMYGYIEGNEPHKAPLIRAQAAFLRDLHVNADGSTVLPVTLESDERRSVERGLALLDAYIYRWRYEPYSNILRADGSPLVEVGFQFPLARYQEYDIIYVGYIDRIMMNNATQRPVNFEGKTTTRSILQKKKEVKPNHQITGYYKPANTLVASLGLPEVKETVWDIMFISDRAANSTKGLTDRFWNYGIDTAKDFDRTTTMRSHADVTEFLFDAEQWALEYSKWVLSGIPRWPRTAPGPCHNYGGCVFRERCSLNLQPEAEPSFMDMNFKVDRWEPWKRIVEAEA